MIEDRGDIELVIAHRADIQHAVAELAHRVVAELGADLEIVGIRRRGVPLAHFVAAGLAGAAGKAPRVHEIGLSRYRDDYSVAHAQPKLAQALDKKVVRGRTVLLVDDLCISGRTLLAAVTHLLDMGAERVRAAVLCSRGQLEVPARPDFCAYRLEVGAGTIVDVRVPPFEDELEIALYPAE